MNNKILQGLLEEEEDDDLLLYYYLKSRKPILSLYINRMKEGSYETLIKRHLNDSDENFIKYCRLNKNQFKFVLSLIHNSLAEKTQRNTISAEEKLYLTLRFMATGESFASLAYQYRISKSYISRIVKQVLHLLRLKLVPITMPPPTENDFKRIESEYWEKWNMPNCIGSIDGKHVRIKSPQHSGSLFFNYKDYFSIVLLAIVDANYKFIAIDVGSYGKEGDSNIFKKSQMGRKICNNRFNIPEPKTLPGTNDILPHFLIGDEAFALDTFMMKPYPQRIARHDNQKDIFNYRLCRARRVVENAFGLLSQVFRVFYIPIPILPETCDDLIVSACCLHNILRDGYLEMKQIPRYQHNDEEIPTDTLTGMASTSGFANAGGLWVRDKLKEYFCSQVGEVSWQNNIVNRIQ